MKRISRCATLLICGVSALEGLSAQQNPAWWNGVIRTGDDHSIPANYAPANLGQLKNIASAAKLHLDDKLAAVGGAGQELDALVSVSNWPSEDPANYAPLTIGQLKNVVDMFYARFDGVGFDYKSQLTSTHSYGGVWTGNPERPWDEAAPIEDNYAPANIGQVKVMFSFDLTGYQPNLPNWWQIQYFGSTGHSPNTVTADGQTLFQEFQNGTDPNALDHPLVGLKVQVIVQ